MTHDEERLLWQEAQRRLMQADAQPPLDIDRVREAARRLDPRADAEPLAAWLARATRRHAFPPSAQRTVTLRPLSRITRLAADAGSEETRDAQEKVLESPDGKFQVSLRSTEKHLLIDVEALGPSSDEFAGLVIALTRSNADWTGSVATAAVGDVIGFIELDEDGDGSIRIPDTASARDGLRDFVIALVMR